MRLLKNLETLLFNMRWVVLALCISVMIPLSVSEGDHGQHDSNETGTEIEEKFSFISDSGFPILVVETALAVFGIFGAYRVRRNRD